MAITHHIGYGPYQLKDFLPGELFARHDGSLGLVCDPQPTNAPPDRILVWVEYRTSNSHRMYLHPDAVAHAVCEEHAWIIERRRKNRSTHFTP